MSLLASTFLFTTPVVAATATPKPTVMMEKTATTTPTMEVQTEVMTKVEYTLPYPGILPDHPLYFLKRLRDQILEKLIADPIRKIEFFMLQSDKGVNTGVFLAAKQNTELSGEAMLRAKTYFEQAVDLAASLKSQGKEVPAYLLERFTNAGAKYKEVLTDLASQAQDAQKTALLSLIAAFDKVQEKVTQLK